MATRRRFRSKEKDKKATSTSYIWAYRSGQGSHEPIVLLDYQPGRGQIHPQTFLGDYRGIVMSDGYSAWRTLEGATHIGCMAHSRRRFVDALKARKKGGGPPEQALRFFEHLYRVERQARDEKPDRGETPGQCIRRLRQQHSIPVLNALKEWLDKIAPKVLPDSKLGDAVSYTPTAPTRATTYFHAPQPPTSAAACCHTPQASDRPPTCGANTRISSKAPIRKRRIRSTVPTLTIKTSIGCNYRARLGLPSAA